MEVKEFYNLSVSAKDLKWEVGKFHQYYFSDYLIIEDVLNEATAGKEYVQQFSINSGLIFSLKVDNEIIGSIQAHNKKSYDTADVSILRLFSPYIINCLIKKRSLASE